MSKKLYIAVLSLNIILSTVLIYFTPYAFATSSDICSQKGVVLTPTRSDNKYNQNEDIIVNVRLTSAAAARITPQWEYTIGFETGYFNQFLKTTEFVKGSDLIDKKTLDLTLKGGLDRPVDYNLVLTHKGDFGALLGVVDPNPDCMGPNIYVLPAGYRDTSCNLSLPANIKYNTAYTIPGPGTTLSLEPKTVSSLEYEALIIPGTIAASVFKLADSTADFFYAWGDKTYGKDVFKQMIDPNSPTIKIPDSLPIGDYTLVIVAIYNGNVTAVVVPPWINWNIAPTEWFQVAKWTNRYGCNVSHFSVTNNETTPAILSSPPASAQLPTQPACSNDENAVNPCTRGAGKKTGACSDPNDPNYDPKNPGIATAIGCIHTNPAELTKDILKFAIGIGGGLAFLMMLLGAYQMLTSAGNPDALKAGTDRLTNAIIGLLFVIFSVLLMQIIGVGILDIPGFGK